MITDKIKQLFPLYGCNAYIIPRNNENFTSQINNKKNRLQYVTNFSGSEGLALITQRRNFLFVDGRYVLQAKREVFKSFTIVEIPKLNLQKILQKQKNIILGFDPRLFTSAFFKEFKNKKNIILQPIENNLVDLICKKKEEKKNSYFSILEEKYSGNAISNKLNTIKKILFNNKSILISDPNLIAWCLNIRDKSQHYNPTVVGKLFFLKNKTFFFTDKSKINTKLEEYFKNILIIEEIHKFESFLSKIKKQKIIIDPLSCSYYDEQILKKNNLIQKDSLSLYKLKSIKNSTEISNIKIANLFDGIAFTKFLIWLKCNIAKEKITEISAQKKLEYFKRLNKSYITSSFPTISAFGANGAIVHYNANKKTNKIINKNNFYLIDSGSQYLFGTTDATRTIGFKNLTKEKKIKFTLVLKAHLQTFLHRFKKNIRGCDLDKIIRKDLISKNMNYTHGTGHGVGYYLNVHEKPYAISPFNKLVLDANVVLTNEPGFYKKNKFGIRIENMMITIQKNSKKYFENLTLIPYDKDCILDNILSQNEKDFINSYHQKIYFSLRPFMNKREKKMLFNMCSSI